METLYITILIIEIFRFCFCRCPNFCSGHGKCEANSKCSCYDGWGSADDTSLYKSHDCSTRVCKYGPSWGNLPDIMNNAHGALLECSGIGICDRTIGLCKCPAGYEGGACERKVCINECSGHGRCYSMNELSILSNYLPLSNYTKFQYGLVSYNNANVWDARRIYGCICDSSWKVGFGPDETQISEWFGPDCSLRHCPSGDDPSTIDIIETNCTGKSDGGSGVGLPGNLCQVDCSNRGICNYFTGTCSCFKNYFGPACSLTN